MSFDIFLQAFMNGTSAEGDVKAMSRVLEPYFGPIDA